MVSPEIATSGDVALRLRAPQAADVTVMFPGDLPGVPPTGLALAKAKDGVWQVTLPKPDSGAYRYRFMVDGVPTNDPNNPTLSQSNAMAWSLFYMPGAAFMDDQGVAHGAVAAVHYNSSALGRTRRMQVYTPPGYERGSDSYPVFYLLHGAFDSDDAWRSVGRAGFIMDNLIAAGTAKPMIVVMPDGHTSRFTMGGGFSTEDFVRDFNADIKPYIESHYRVLTDRRSTAIAGLSMGGAQTLDIAFGDLAEYAYLGVFSSGIFSLRDESSDWEMKHSAQLDDAALKDGLELFWFATGREDFLVETTAATVALLKQHGFEVTYKQTEGGHTWVNWREYLKEFAQQIFQE